MPADYLQGSLYFHASSVPMADDELSDRGYRLYTYLAKRAATNGCSWPSKKTMAEDLKKSIDWVKRALADLKESGWLASVKRSRPNGSDTSNLYRLCAYLPSRDGESGDVRTPLWAEAHPGGADMPPAPGADMPPPELNTSRTSNHLMSTSDDRQQGSNGTDWNVVASTWNKLAERYGLRQVRVMTDTRKGLYRSRLSENPEYWKELGGALSNLGEFARDKGFVTLDFCLRASGHAKLVEGNYAGEAPVAELSEEDAELEKLLNPGPREGYAR